MKLLEVPDEETDLELPKYTAEEALEFKKDNIGYLVTKHDEAIAELNADLKVIDEYKEKVILYYKYYNIFKIHFQGSNHP